MIRTVKLRRVEPGNSGSCLVDVDRTRNLIWVNEMMADQIARFAPRTKTFVGYPIPSHYASVRRIEVDPSRPSRVWYTAFYVDKVGYLAVLESGCHTGG